VKFYDDQHCYFMSTKDRSASAIERLTVALPGRLAKAVRKAVTAGEYASTSEVVRDALRLWEGRRELRARDMVVLRRAWDEGKASGRWRPRHCAPDRRGETAHSPRRG
jgi:antitoxin ParD1/3/4